MGEALLDMLNVEPKMTEMKKVAATSVAASPIGAIVAWAWNGLYPDYQMPAEVAAAADAVITNKA